MHCNRKQYSQQKEFRWTLIMESVHVGISEKRKTVYVFSYLFCMTLTCRLFPGLEFRVNLLLYWLPSTAIEPSLFLLFDPWLEQLINGFMPFPRALEQTKLVLELATQIAVSVLINVTLHDTSNSRELENKTNLIFQ